jgi:uncharacterized protein YhaN
MRLERVELDGFGRFHGASWELPDGLTVVRGANEAGKTTFLNALRALLFGFEATRDGRTWYPAFAGGRRGGRLVLRTAAGERWVVERHGERGGTGSLAVRAPNGNQGGQETLDRLMRGADKDLFNNIFAFGLGELQNIHSLSTEGVRGRIYGASAGLGGSSAVDLEAELRSQLRETFVPSGTKPPLNDLLGRIERLRAEVADLARQPEEHAAAHRELEELSRRADELRASIRDRRERVVRYARLRTAGPIAAELGIVGAELTGGDPSLDAVPEDAVAVLDRRLGELAEASATLAALDEQLADARGRRGRIEVDEPVLAVADEVTAVVEERAARAAADGRRSDLQAAAARATAAVAEQLARVGGWDEARLVALDDSIPVVEATRAHERELEATRIAAAEAEQRRRAAAEELALREREGGIDPGLDDTALEGRAAALRDLESLRLERAAAEARASTRGPAAALPPAMRWAAALAFLALGSVAGWLAGATMVGAAVGAAAAGFLLLLTRPARAAGPTELAELDARRTALLGALGLGPEASDAEVRAAADTLAAERARRQIGREQRSSLDARRSDVERRARDAETAAAAARAARDAWAGWLEQRGLPAGATPDAVRQLLTAAGTARRAAHERDGHALRLAELEAADDAFARRADALLASLGIPAPPDAARRNAGVLNLGTRLEDARAEQRRAEELDATIEGLEARRIPAAAAVTERKAAVAAHLEQLGCPDADALRRRATEAAGRREVRRRVRELRERLAAVAGSVEAIDTLAAEATGCDPAELAALEAETQEELARLEQDEREALNRIGALEARIRQLESADELGTRRQELAMLDGQAAAMARDWSVRALTLKLLEETRARYERERQPDVVRAAESHFERVTGGRYVRIVAAPGDASVRVETEGGEARVTDELSRGTAEQLYLALRFGLIEEFARHAEPLPVVMDDILVNFDADRAARAAAAIRDLAERHQVLYFTCHATTAALLDPAGSRTLALA